MEGVLIGAEFLEQGGFWEPRDWVSHLGTHPAWQNLVDGGRDQSSGIHLCNSNLD